MPAKAYSGPQRTKEEIVLYLTPGQPTPTTVPFELQSHIQPDVFAARLPVMQNLAAQYFKPKFEAIWMFVGFLSAIILPSVLYNVILTAMFNKNPDSFDNSNTDFFFEVRAISLGLFVGVVLFFFIPLFVWKFIGSRRAKALLAKWAREDHADKGPSAFVPTWRVQMPGVFSPRVTLRISAPPPTKPSSFHPDAYLPSYINGPTDGGGDAYYYPYKGGAAGMPHMSMVGNLPQYAAYGSDEKYPIDEKRGFEDVRV